jgi:exonuclease III
VKTLILKEKLDVLCLQETEIDNNFNHNLSSFPGYNFEFEKNDVGIGGSSSNQSFSLFTLMEIVSIKLSFLVLLYFAINFT